MRVVCGGSGDVCVCGNGLMYVLVIYFRYSYRERPKRESELCEYVSGSGSVVIGK